MSVGSTAPARGQRRAALVAVASEMFARKPYDEIYISDIAKEAGVAHGLLFYHFKDKRGLYLEVLRQMQAEIAALHDRRPGEDTNSEWLRGVVRRQIEYRRDHVHTSMAIMRAGGQDPEVDELVEQTRRSGVCFLRRLLGVEGEPVPQLRVAMRGAMGAVDEMTVDWLAHDLDLDLDQLIEFAYGTVLAILGSVCTAGDHDITQALDALRPAG
ncbi:TetR/AcrR family transcriptional regulator [Kutzneria buriramensis]|uniref:AcrR family transcriptional regulator n=1 Tax=Kutzneria buriramensis TaxID=1045776 RepID=A0A3E0GYZ7_9PSEU|nr:TetR/AcrR family transcriptional regulator [Kutzneria buriramensis]REH33026.1 AcrR family transcriptional regulator [Kutzneria buriramensis]